jgi:hypothetical protein
MKQARFVIFASPSQRIVPGSCYIARDGSRTMISAKAATFNRFAQAKTFAEANHIVLSARTYIGREDFTDLEMCG